MTERIEQNDFIVIPLGKGWRPFIMRMPTCQDWHGEVLEISGHYDNPTKSERAKAMRRLKPKRRKAKKEGKP